MDAIDPHARSLRGRTDYSRRALLTTGLGTGFALAVLPVSAETITTDADGLTAGDVTIPVKDGQIPGYRAMPAKGGPFPTVIVIQEVFGLHEHIKDMCRRFAKVGYFAVAPALYSRLPDVTKLTDMQEVIKVSAQAPEALVMSDLDATLAWARRSGKADTRRLGVTGFCRGGSYTWLYATHNPHVKAAVAWYGPLVCPNADQPPISLVDATKDLKVPVLGLYGAADQGIPAADVEKFRDGLRKSKKTVQFVIYPDAPHGFNADYRPSYRPDAAKDGWKRLLAWFKKYGAA
ncbi:MAG TPA: dienelactone hydrolase family protein [Alphaproteobacteria bacterium]|jgi:carboxymethylenebutenolidase|nr:dienelactone hydrolase family protein [Alphaproteobacteria bacterium]